MPGALTAAFIVAAPERGSHSGQRTLPLETPFFTDSAIFFLRSIEYAFMSLRYPVHLHRNPL